MKSSWFACVIVLAASTFAWGAGYPYPCQVEWGTPVIDEGGPWGEDDLLYPHNGLMQQTDSHWPGVNNYTELVAWGHSSMMDIYHYGIDCWHDISYQSACGSYGDFGQPGRVTPRLVWRIARDAECGGVSGPPPLSMDWTSRGAVWLDGVTAGDARSVTGTLDMNEQMHTDGTEYGIAGPAIDVEPGRWYYATIGLRSYACNVKNSYTVDCSAATTVHVEFQVLYEPEPEGP